MNRYALFAALFASAALVSAPANAALITQSFNMTADKFEMFGGTGTPPYETFSGKFAVKFDNTTNVESTNTGLSISEFTGSALFAMKYAYNAADDTLVFATTPYAKLYDQAACNTNPNNSFCFFVTSASTTLADTPATIGAVYYKLNNATFMGKLNVVRTTDAAVPEPTTWMMMVLGFGAMGCAIRRRKTVFRIA